MTVRPNAKFMAQFAPQAYYETWAEHWKLDAQKYPYLKTDFDPSLERVVPFAVYSFDLVKGENGSPLSLAFVQYKSLFSKSSFTVTVYL